MFKDENLATFDATVQGWFRAVRIAAAEAALGMAKQAFKHLLDISPQYSGDFVANWKVGTAITPAFDENAVLGARHEPFQMGSPEAISYAKTHAVWPTLTLGESVFLYNNAAHDEPYALKIEQGLIALRPVNQGADHVRDRALAYTLGRNKHINTPGHLAALRRVGV